jgi:hypothetical protein
MVGAAWMEKIMSKANDTSNLATLEHHDDALADNELDAANGGLVVIAIIAVLIGLLHDAPATPMTGGKPGIGPV